MADYTELVKSLRWYERYSDNSLFGRAADAIEELEKKMLNWQATADDHWEAYQHWFHKYMDDVPKWIPVTERLPEKPGNYLTAMGNGRIIENVYMKDDSDAWKNWHPHGKWYYNEAVWAGITHWMPLPEPPKEET